MGKTLKFVDGIKEVYEGMKVVTTNGQDGHHLFVHETKIEKIGREYITLSDGRRFSLETGKEKTIYAGGKIYTSREAYNTAKNQAQFIYEVSTKLRDILSRLTYEQAVKFDKVLKEIGN
jgi:hypothetical protein